MESGGGGGSRRRRSLSDDKIDSANLRDFLRVKEDDNNDDERRHSLAGLTLSAILATEKRPQVNRTLLDIIRDDPNGGGFKDHNKKSWKSFKDKLRLRRAGSAWTSTVHIPTSDVPIQNHNNNNNNRMISRRNSTRFPTTTPDDDPTPSYNRRPELSSSSSGTSINVSENRADTNPAMMNDRAMMMRRNSSRIPSLASSHAVRREGSLNSSESPDHHRPVLSPEEDEAEEGAEEEEEEGGGGEQPVRMSLMALLAETDREMGLDGSTYMMNDGDDDEEEEEEEEVEESGGRGVGEYCYNNCCVCMVRHKGSAFIPCGHTFCRLCSRELWVQRGNCPLCNGFILEILDIF